jgi:hypothetical protein
MLAISRGSKLARFPHNCAMGCDSAIETQARASATVTTMEVCGEKRGQFYFMLLESCAHTRAQPPLCLAAYRCSEAYASLAVEKRTESLMFCFWLLVLRRPGQTLQLVG